MEHLGFALPPERIAQYPSLRRGGSRLLILDRGSGVSRHSTFEELPKELRPGDLIVRNDSRVIAARLRGTRAWGGEIELLLLECVGKEADSETWTSLVRPGRRWRKGDRASFRAGIAAIALDDSGERGIRAVRLESPRPVLECLDEAGETPLPPYIRRPSDARDREAYQTIYARSPGSVAAPTAGLHFTDEMFARLRSSEVELADLTLHVGPGTFLPLETRDTNALGSERVHVPPATATAVNRAKAEGRRVIAIGTTTARALEGFAHGGRVEPGERRTALFIAPGHRFQIVDALVTNFHLPHSSLLLLVAAFAGRELILAAYREAIEREYRFYSYGDAMLIV